MDIALQLAQIPKPAGIVVGGFRIDMYQGGSHVRAYAGAAPSTVFTDVPNGDYTITAERVDSNGGLIGTRVERAFTVTGGEMVDVPVGILVDGA